GRPLAQIEAGTGRAPKAFMRASNAVPVAKANAVWHSNRDDTAETDVTPQRPVGESVGKRTRGGMPEVNAPQLAKLVGRPPAGEGGGKEIKLDGYGLHLRVENSGASLKTRKGLDWTHKFPEIARAAGSLPDCIVDGEVCAVNEHGVPDFAALQAALAGGDSKAL